MPVDKLSGQKENASKKCPTKLMVKDASMKQCRIFDDLTITKELAETGS